MDFQYGIVERAGSPAVLAAADRAVKAARSSDIPVMFVRVAFRPGYPEAGESNLAFGAISQAGDAFTQDHPATQVHAALEPLPDEPVIVKRRVSAFSGSDLDVLLLHLAAERRQPVQGLPRPPLAGGPGLAPGHTESHGHRLVFELCGENPKMMTRWPPVINSDIPDSSDD